MLCFSLITGISPAAWAKDLGVIGPTYPIVEADLLVTITQRLQNLQQHGELQALQQQWQQQVEQQADRPLPVAGMTKATENRRTTMDMSITLKQAITDENGRIIYPAGTRINPFDYSALTNTLLFIDGDDLQQVQWAQKLDKAQKGKTKLILVKGSLKAMNQKWSKAVYFDQSGALSHKLNIQHLPAEVHQQDKQLQIVEVKLP